MAQDGFSFFYNKLGLNISDLAFYYDFSLSGDNVAVTSGNSLLSGDINANPLFWDEFGSGNLSGLGIDVSNFDTLRKKNWSYLLVPEKTENGSEVLLSTMDSGMNSGFVVSMTSSNDLIFTTKDSNGYLFSETFDLPLSDKSILGITKAGTSITCFSYDPSELSAHSASRAFPSSCLINNFEQLSIGKSSANISNPFQGYIDEAALINSTINKNQFKTLASGFVRPAYAQSVVESSGFEFGAAYCVEGDYISGFEPSIISQIVETPSSIDFDFLSTFKKSGIKYKNCQDITNFYVVYIDGNPIKTLNESIYFDSLNGYYRSESTFNFGDLLFFYNGLLQNKISDYTYSSKMLVKSGSSIVSSGVLDSEPNEYSISSFVSGDLISGYSSVANNGNSILFLNGNILISGQDYNADGANFVFLNGDYETFSGEITEIKFLDSEISVQSTSSKFIERDFYDNNLMCFVDGLRIDISNFKQVGSTDSNFNSNSTPCFSGGDIYNNEGSYFNE